MSELAFISRTHITGAYEHRHKVVGLSRSLRAKIHPNSRPNVHYDAHASPRMPLDDVESYTHRTYQAAPCEPGEFTVVTGGLFSAHREMVAYMAHRLEQNDGPLAYYGRTIGSLMLEREIAVVNDQHELIQVINESVRQQGA